MNDYIYLEEESGGLFANLVLRVDELGIFEITRCKIDTGCAKTNIPIRRLNISNKRAEALKQKAINEKVPYNPTYGVSDTIDIRKKDKDLIKNGNLMDVKSLRFNYNADSITLDDQWLGGCDIGINFDRTGNILIGLDILKRFQIIIDTSVITGKYTLIGCLKSQPEKETYYNAIKKHFLLHDNCN